VKSGEQKEQEWRRKDSCYPRMVYWPEGYMVAKHLCNQVGGGIDHGHFGEEVGGIVGMDSVVEEDTGSEEARVMVGVLVVDIVVGIEFDGNWRNRGVMVHWGVGLDLGGKGDSVFEEGDGRR
jgi:hypothetical protein